MRSKRDRRHALGRGLYLAAVLCCASAAARAAPTDAPSGESATDIPAKSKRKLGKVSKPADFSGAGLLQLEYGYDGDFRAPDSDRDQAGTISLLFNATEDLQLELDFDTFHAVTSPSSSTEVGIGDAYLSAQVTAFPESSQRPALSFVYLIKFPTADESSGLGTGHVDHKGSVLVSKKWGMTAVDCAASLLINGDSEADPWDAGFQMALGFTHDLRHAFSLQTEIFGETLDTDQPQGLFVQGGVVHQPGGRTSFDLGARAGLSPDAPRFGIFAGLSLNLGNVGGAGD